MAGRDYNFEAGYDWKGVGIELSHFRGEETIIVNVEGIDYTLDCEEALNFAKKHRAVKRMQTNTLVIVSKSLLKEVQ